MVTMSLEEAEAIARHRLPAEGPPTDWRGQQEPAPAKPARGLDTMPEPQIDWSSVISQALKTERALLTEATGQAIGEVRSEICDEIEALRVEMRAEVERLRAEFSQATRFAIFAFN